MFEVRFFSRKRDDKMPILSVPVCQVYMANHSDRFYLISAMKHCKYGWLHNRGIAASHV
jgi:hypothetical protein